MREEKERHKEIKKEIERKRKAFGMRKDSERKLKEKNERKMGE